MTLTEVTPDERSRAYQLGRRRALAHTSNPYSPLEEPVLHQDYKDGIYDERMRQHDESEKQRG